MNDSPHTYVERVRAAGKDGWGAIANEILYAIGDGAPVDGLIELIRSDEVLAAKAGVWVMSELGSAARPLLDEMPQLLRHESPYVRYLALEVVLNCSDHSDGRLIASAMQLVADGDRAVRMNAMRFLANATTEQLDAGAACLDDGPIKDGARWLSDVASRRRPLATIVAKLDDPRDVTRRVAASAALRVVGEANIYLDATQKSADGEIAEFARSEIEIRG